MRSGLILTLWLLAKIGMAQNAFEISRSEKSDLIDKAHSTVKSYSLSLQDMGDSTYQYYEKDPFRTDILNLFYNNDTKILNDIDAAGNLSKDISISTYLYDIQDRYRNHGVVIKTEIDYAKSNNLFVADQPDMKYFFVKVVAERTVKGKDNLERTIDQTRPVDIYVLYIIGEKGYDPNPYIYSITEHGEHTDYTEVGIIGEPQRAAAQTSTFETTKPVSPQTRPPVNPKPEVEEPPVAQNRTITTNAPCNEPATEPRFNSSSDHKKQWKDFIYSSNAYRKAVKEQGVRCVGTIYFTVKADGSIVGVTLGEGGDGCHNLEQGFMAVQQIMQESTQNGNGWIAARENCVEVSMQISGEVIFTPSKIREKTTSSTPVLCNTPAYYISSGTMSEHDAWKAFYQQDTVFERAVENGLRGKVISTFIVNTNGTLDLRDVEKQFIGVSDSNRIKVGALVNGLLARSSQQGDDWNPEKKDCQSVKGEASVTIVFDQPKVMLTPANRKPVPQEPKKPLTEKQLKRAHRQAQKDVISCQRNNHSPKFNSCRHHRRAWKEYVSKQPEFVEAVLEDGVKGLVDGRVPVNKQGEVDLNSAKIRMGNSVNMELKAEKVFNQVLASSTESGNEWHPAKSKGVPAYDEAKVHLSFKKRNLDPTAAIASKLLSDRGERKMGRKATWQEHKEEKIGGVHFSIGGVGGIDEEVTGGVEAALGGLFGNVFGMEARYTYLIGPEDHVIGLGMLFNASPKRWPTRFYFPIRGSVHLQNRGLPVYGVSVGLLCLDIKLGKKASMYFEFADGELRFEPGGNVRPYWTPSIGFRFSRW